MSAAKTTRPRGFADWTPRPDTVALLGYVKEVLDEYRDHLPLTIRQVFYRLVGAAGYDKTERAYARLCEMMNRARRAGFIPFHAIRDDGGSRLGGAGWGSAAQYLRYLKSDAETFQLDRQAGQPVRLWLMCEAAGMAPMLARAVQDYHIPVLSSGGFDSLTAKHDLAEELARADLAEVLHVGDHDPSGVHLFTALQEDVSAMVRAKGGADPVFTRLAVTPEQTAALGLPTAPPKKTDRRAFEGDTVQAEAIPPDVLAEIVQGAVVQRIDRAAYNAVLTQEKSARAEILQRLEALK